MPGKSKTPSGMLDSYLYQTNTFTDRLAQHGYVLGLATSSENDAAALRRAKNDMTAMTDPVLLRRAREDQQGLMDGSRSYT
ncbi:hypothetical protein LTS17_005440 [Exophiala oligosperma]